LAFVSTEEFDHEKLDDDALKQEGAVVYARAGVAVVHPLPGLFEDLRASADGRAGVIELEGLVRAATDATGHAPAQRPMSDAVTAVGCLGSTNASGVVIALLDTGLDDSIPGLRVSGTSLPSVDSSPMPHAIQSAALINGEPTDEFSARFSVAVGATLLSAAVLDSKGYGRDGDVIAGIDWAITGGARVIVMPLSRHAVWPAHDEVFEGVAANVLAQGSVIFAAAGNHQSVFGRHRMTGHPANCPSIVAVGAANERFDGAASFSNGSGRCGVDLLAPGTSVPTLTTDGRPTSVSGTSAATALAGGVAGVHVHDVPGLSGVELRTRVLESSRRLAGDHHRVGAGLVQV
jgi:subtilisin